MDVHIRLSIQVCICVSQSVFIESCMYTDICISEFGEHFWHVGCVCVLRDMCVM